MYFLLFSKIYYYKVMLKSIYVWLNEVWFIIIHKAVNQDDGARSVSHLTALGHTYMDYIGTPYLWDIIGQNNIR